MSYMCEVYYKAPSDREKEEALAQSVKRCGGRLTYREEPRDNAMSVCLTFEFDSLEQAGRAAESLRAHGEHVEGPVDYGSATPVDGNGRE